jgi:UDP-glucose 4-epimerase
MNILIAGNLTCLTDTLARAFTNEKMKVVIAGPHARDLNMQLPNVSAYAVALTDRPFRQLISSFKFDAVIYLATREEQLLAGSPWSAGQVLDGLQDTLESCKAEGVKKFFFVSSTEVYGDQEDTAETAEVQPASPNGYSLEAGEQTCRYYGKQSGLNVTIVRVPFLYGPEEKGGLLYRLLQDCRANDRVLLPAAEDTVVSLLPATGLADFLLRALDSEEPGWQVVNLSSAHPISLGQLAELLKLQFHGLEAGFDPTHRILTRAVTVSTAKQHYDWFPVDQLATDLPGLVDAMQPHARPRGRLEEWLGNRFPKYPVYLKWAEVFLGALVMMWLTELTGSFVEFRYVDFRLMYVILMGSMYGTQVGLVAAVLACLSVVIGSARLGLAWTELVYNVANWLPFAVYLTAGALTGYLQDKKENEANFQNQQNRLISEKYEFLYGVHQDIVQIKDQYYQQLLGSRDSFGRIFNITRELDMLEEQEVLFKALNILEDVMGSPSIAIYSLHSSIAFARLEVCSSPLNDRISRSLDLESFPELQECIRKGEIYQNRRQLPHYPAYFAPILSDAEPVAAMAIWDAKFEQSSLYYQNLFRVICGLIQSSIHRAIEFLSANRDKLYVPGTLILQAEPFKRILRVRNTMKEQKTGNYLLAGVTTTGPNGRKADWARLERSLSGVIRSVDDLGLLDDGNLYVMFSQADKSHALNLNGRLSQSGLCLEPVIAPLEDFLLEMNGKPVKSNPKGVKAVGESHE